MALTFGQLLSGVLQLLLQDISVARVFRLLIFPISEILDVPELECVQSSGFCSPFLGFLQVCQRVV